MGEAGPECGDQTCWAGELQLRAMAAENSAILASHPGILTWTPKASFCIDQPWVTSQMFRVQLHKCMRPRHAIVLKSQPGRGRTTNTVAQPCRVLNKLQGHLQSKPSCSMPQTSRILKHLLLYLPLTPHPHFLRVFPPY